MNRLMMVACLAALLCGAPGCCDKANNRLDIALEGPWILYQETQFQGDGTSVPVLIAIAPSEAIDYGDTGANNQHQPDGLHHKPPQLSTGDGFYITHPDIYCLTFDGKCAPRGPESLNKDSYPSPQPLILNSHNPKGASTPWDWFTLVTGHKHTALILPMPDSYSNDGVWHMRFASTFNSTGQGYGNDEPHSIGLHLHYAHGPDNLNLLLCQGRPSIANCKKPPTSSEATRLANNGTLRIQLRAPESTVDKPAESACDLHVRMAYKQMFASLLNSSFNSQKAVVEPAEGTVGDDKPVFEGVDQNGVDHGHFCFDKDPQNPQTYIPMASVNISIPTLITQIGTIVEKLSITPPPGAPANLQESLLLPEIKDASAGLDPAFPRISQVQRISELVRLSKAQLDGLNSKVNTNAANHLLKADRRNGTLGDYYRTVEDAETPVANADSPKNGNDCRAATVIAQ
jgi:hypothetical protein